jgi:transcriptional regulator with XRE-family HTH domain
MTTPYPIHFSAQLRQHLRSLRKKLGITQAQLGARIGVSQARIAEIEASPGLVSVDQLLQILSVLDTTISLTESTNNLPQQDGPAKNNDLTNEKLDLAPANGTTAPKKLSTEETKVLAPIGVKSNSLDTEESTLSDYLARINKNKKGSW